MTEQDSDIIGIREILLAPNEQVFLDKLRVLEGQIGSYETCISWLNRELGVQEDWFCYQTLQSAMQDAQRAVEADADNSWDVYLFQRYLKCWFFGFLAGFPENEAAMKEIECLNFSREQLFSVPWTVVNFTDVTEIGLAGNDYEELPDIFDAFRLLETLYINRNGLRSIPDSVTRLPRLTRLDLSENDLSFLPDTIGDLTSLQEISLGANLLEKLPDTIGNLSHLYNLSLGTNALSSLPESLQNLSQIKTLDLMKNGLGSCSEEQLRTMMQMISQLPGLDTLYLCDNEFAAMPTSLSLLRNIKTLAFRWNSLKESDLVNFPSNIEVLDLEETSLAELSEGDLEKLFHGLGQSNSLKELNLYNTGLSIIPDSISRLKNLKTLKLGKNTIKRFPESISHLSSLTEIYLQNNQFSSMSEEELSQLFLSMSRLPNLEKLVVSVMEWSSNGDQGYELPCLPEEIGLLKNLKYLECNSHKLKSLPTSISQLSETLVMQLESNSIAAASSEEIQALIAIFDIQKKETSDEEKADSFLKFFFSSVRPYIRLRNNELSEEAKLQLTEALPHIEFDF